MEANPYIPWLLWSTALLLLWLAVRGLKRKSVLGWAGTPKTPSELGYYPVMGSYLLGGILVLLLALADAHRRWGWLYTVLFTVGPLLLIFLLSKIKVRSFSILSTLSRLRGRKDKAPKTTATPQTRALAPAALQAHVKGLDFHTLGGALPNPRSQKQARKRLQQEWQIEAEEDLEETLEWLMESGHRKEFQEQIGTIQHWGAEETEAYLAEVAEGKYGLDTPEEQEEERHRIAMAQQNIHGVRGISFMAWDYLRAIDLCREGHLAGFIQSEAAWNRIMSAAQVLQSRYDNWEEMGRSFLIAHEYWSVVQHRTLGSTYQRALALLLQNPDSPWNRIPWESPLYDRI